MMTTATIAGHTLTLTSGIRYIASRPFAMRGRMDFDVTIEPINDPEAATVIVFSLSYREANALINEFNNGPTSFDGRIW